MRKDFELVTALTPWLTWGMLHNMMCTMLPRDSVSSKTEDTPGTGANWFFLLPNVHGVRDDSTHFNGIAIKLRHGTVISWDGRVVKHCTAVPIPGGNNHVYGTFTAAKERIVGVGCALAGKSKLSDDSATGPSSADDGFDASGGKLQRSK
jgi:hypothetical protein